jgi:heme-degrading monooxygenase HmoA
MMLSCKIRVSDSQEHELILEVAILNVKPGETARFEAAFASARPIIAAAPGCLSHELQRCMEVEGQYVLLVRWDSVASHMEGFRKSAGYPQWRRLLHHFYDPFPTVHHYLPVGEERI